MAAVAALVVLFMLLILIWIAGIRRLVRFAFTYGLAVVLVAVGYFAFREYENMNQRKLLEERASALFNQTIQPGSVYACMDGSPSPAMQDACERTLFAEPHRVATAITITSQRVGYLIDAVRFASTRDRDYATRIAPLRRVIESDPYGFVGFVLASSYNCMADLCDKFQILDNPERVKENIRSRRYEAYMAKYAGVWRGEPLPEDKKPGSDTVLPGVAIGDKPRNLIPLDTGPPALFDPVPRGNPMPSGPIPGPHTTPPAAATRPDVMPPPTVGGPPRAKGTEAAPAAPARVQTPPDANPFTPVSVPVRPAAPAAMPARPIMVDPADEKGQKKAAPKSEPKAEQPKASEKQKSAVGAPKTKGELYRGKGNEPVAGLPRLVPGDYLRPDPNEPRETLTPSGVIMNP